MSRIGRKPITFEKSVQVAVTSDRGDKVLTVKSGKYAQNIKLPHQIEVVVNDNKITFNRKDELKQTKALHGLVRSLTNNAVTGVTTGWKKSLELKGVGYRANVKGRNLELTVGYSHPVVLMLPKDVEVKVEKQTLLHITGPDKNIVGEFCAKIRSFRSPEPYLGKGIKYVDEMIIRKAGKSGAK